MTVLTSQGLELPAESEENGVRVIRVPVFFRRQQAAANLPSMLAYLPMGIKAGKKLLRQIPFDVINTHFVLPTGPVGDTLARFAQVPNVLSVHGGDLYDPSKWTSPHRHALLRVWVRKLLRRANQVVGQSRNTLQNIRDFYSPEIKCVRIPLGIKRPLLKATPSQQYKFGENDVLLVTVGRLVARKAVEQLISMMGSLNTADAHLLIIGTGPHERLLREKARELHIEGRVHFLGHVEESEKFQILQMSDVFVSTSQHEGFGLVFLEAMASGLPVVCYDHGGQTDFLEDGYTGYVLALNDLPSFTESCRRLVNDADSRKRMGQKNRQRVEDLFIDRCAALYENLFNEVIKDYRKERVISYSRRT